MRTSIISSGRKFASWKQSTQFARALLKRLVTGRSDQQFINQFRYQESARTNPSLQKKPRELTNNSSEKQSEKLSDPTRYRVILAIVAVLFVLRAVEYHTGTIITPQIPGIEIAVFLLLALPWIIHRQRATSVIIMLITWGLEYLGQKTGWPFGEYTYDLVQ